MALLILSLLLAFNVLQAAVLGYPSNGVNIIYKDQAIIQNDFCFPVVVTVNTRDIMVEKNSKSPLGIHKWNSWNWMPGKINGLINSKSVSHPLKGKPKVSFGPEEAETHKGFNSFGYDFSIPEGTPVLAMEKGIVVRVIGQFKVPHQDKTRMEETNTIEVIHEDGTVARYSHLSPGSSKVKHCEVVNAGQVLALSGHVGYSAGPHLHVDILRPVDGENYRTIPLKFK
ncbi:MAG TPA: M23 family metallopeptidase [Bacteriovoracaceae bacterium]|nr:M23 family metallopeptidase [Bacteriovoracaceae bacterium]